MTRAILLGLLTLGMGGCDWMPGKPRPDPQWAPPSAVLDFQTLRTENWQGCHGGPGTISGAISLDDPTWLAVIPPEKLRDIIVNGVPDTGMPPFSQTHGGLLTEEQIGVLTQGILAWKSPQAPQGFPPYSAPPGNAAAGEKIYSDYVTAIGTSAGPEMLGDGFLANPAFLGLTSDQYLRTLVITGRPELGIPNFRSVIPGRPLGDQDIADIVAWLISQRKNEFGQPLTPPLP